ncbi:MAG: hypothetical protein ACKV2V_21520 [Blastocatellia bacterium]
MEISDFLAKQILDGLVSPLFSLRAQKMDKVESKSGYHNLCDPKPLMFPGVALREQIILLRCAAQNARVTNPGHTRACVPHQGPDFWPVLILNDHQ